MPTEQQEKLPKEREHYVLDNLSLVHYCIKKTFHIHPCHQDYDDYFQEGCCGLILAAIRFDDSKGFKFTTYSYKMILSKILSYRRDKYNIIKIPRDRYNLLCKVIELHMQGYSTYEIQEITGYDGTEIQHALSVAKTDSIDRVILDDNTEHSLSEVISTGENQYEELIQEDNIVSAIEGVTNRLKTQVHKDIWKEYIYSMIQGENLKQQYFSAKYHVSQAYVSRLIRNCKKMLIKLL